MFSLGRSLSNAAHFFDLAFQNSTFTWEILKLETNQIVYPTLFCQRNKININSLIITSILHFVFLNWLTSSNSTTCTFGYLVLYLTLVIVTFTCSMARSITYKECVDWMVLWFQEPTRNKRCRTATVVAMWHEESILRLLILSVRRYVLQTISNLRKLKFDTISWIKLIRFRLSFFRAFGKLMLRKLGKLKLKSLPIKFQTWIRPVNVKNSFLLPYH